MAIYTKNDLKTRINAGIKGKIGVLVNANDTMNQAVREVLAEADLRSTRRVVSIQPGIFDSIYAYPGPTDLKAQKLLSLHAQAPAGSTYYGFNLIPYEQFNQRFGYYGRNSENIYANPVTISEREPFTVAFDDLNGVRVMLLAAPQNGQTQTLATLDSLTDNGSWGGYGDISGLIADTGNRLYGSASLKFNIAGLALTTAGIVNATMAQFDISDFLTTNSSVFTAAYLSNATEITNFTIRIGNDASNYYEMIVTSTHVNTAFTTGWNVLRFDLSTRSETGTVNPATMDYIALFMTKDTTKINQNDFRFDHIVIQKGDIYEVRYYSKYGWQTQAGVWLENSVNDDDFLNADMDEFNLFIDKGIMLAGQEVDELVAAETAGNRYDRNLERYLSLNPSESLIETSDYQAQYYI